ncbi:SLATT domain-containing protein [Kribbella sp. NBC_00359]|uniref:SLATT domain-containing protein n=1 Tax=Kribbella sp. NBC_00359 TaxID=2975966 RepID=UPI002E1BD2EA
MADAVERLEERAFKTYKSRLAAHHRLSSRNNAWNASLIALSTATTIASVGLLSDAAMYGERGETLLAALAILALVASLVVANMNYGARSRSMEANYKRIQQISMDAENLRLGTMELTEKAFLTLQREYGIAVESSENHSQGDYGRTSKVKSLRGEQRRDTAITLAPYLSIIAPILIVIPFVQWIVNGW